MIQHANIEFIFSKKNQIFWCFDFFLQLFEEFRHSTLYHSKIELSRWDSQHQNSETSEKQQNKMKIINFSYSISKQNIQTQHSNNLQTKQNCNDLNKIIQENLNWDNE